MTPISRVLAPTAVVAALLLAACGGDKSGAADAKAPPAATPAKNDAAALAVQLVEARQQPITRGVTVSGAVAAWEDMVLGVELSGQRVARVAVEVGDHVKQGQVLLTVDARTVESELRQAEAAHEEARAGLVLAQSNLRRGDELMTRKLLSQADHDQLRAAVVQAQARVSTTQAQRDAARLRVEFATLRAPDDGVIAQRMVQPGQVVMAGAELMRMIRQGRLEWRAELSEADLPGVAVGAEVRVRTRAGGEVVGRVRTLSPGLDANTRTATVYVDLPDPGDLRAGMFAEGRILLGEQPALVVPASAVVRRDGYSYVFTVDEQQRAHRLRVDLGHRDGDEVEVREGLSAGARVIGKGAAFLSDGDPVRVVGG